MSRLLITKVLAVVSKQFYKLIKRAQFEVDLHLLYYPDSLAAYCCQKGYASLLKYALDNGSSVRVHSTSVVSEFGYLGCLKVLVEHGCEIHKDALDTAARNGRLAVFEYLLEETNLDITKLTINFAVLSGNVQLFEYIRASKSESIKCASF